MENLAESGSFSDHPASPQRATSFPLKQIVAICDGSPAGENAAWRAALLAREHAAGLRLLWLPARRSRGSAAQTGLDSIVAELQRRLQLEVRAEFLAGPASKEIPRAAAQADLIVLRAAGPRPITEWLAGTHPAWLLRQVERPMLVVRKPATVGYRRVLASAAFDGHAAAVIAAATAVIRGPHQQVFEALAAHRDLARSGDLRDRDGLLAARRVRTVVQEVMLREGHARHVREAPVVVLDHSPQPLLRHARTVFAELLVLARRRSDERGRWLARGEAQEVLTAAACDVLLLTAPLGGCSQE